MVFILTREKESVSEVSQTVQHQKDELQQEAKNTVVYVVKDESDDNLTNFAKALKEAEKERERQNAEQERKKAEKRRQRQQERERQRDTQSGDVVTFASQAIEPSYIEDNSTKSYDDSSSSSSSSSSSYSSSYSSSSDSYSSSSYDSGSSSSYSSSDF